MGVKPPSLYAAFGSKSGVFARAIEVYKARTSKQFVAAFNAKTTAEFFELILTTAARFDAEHPTQRGCLILDCARNTEDAAAQKIAKASRRAFAGQIEDKLKALGVDDASFHAQACMAALTGLSGAAKHGTQLEVLLDIARLMANGLAVAA